MVPSSLMFGQIIDKFGPRNAMMLSQAGTGIAYLMLALSYDIPTLFLSRIPTVFMSCMLCAQGALPAYVDQHDRATAMGRLSVSYLLGVYVYPNL
jgi:MFS family permease